MADGSPTIESTETVTVWADESSSAVCKVGIGGDFLPAGGSEWTAPASWSEAAKSLRPYIQDLDLTVVNLECPLDVDGLHPRVKMALGASFAAPAAALDYLLALLGHLAGIANNHIYDYGAEGVACTQKVAARRNITTIGCNATLAESPDVHVWDGPRGVRIGFWAAARGLDESATQKRRGVEPATLKRGRDALSAMKFQGASLRIAMIHTGMERTNRPDTEDVALMNALANEGFDVVAAAHSHRIGGHAVLDRGSRRPAVCFYGLGSIASSVMYTPLEREGLLIVLGVDANGKLVRVESKPIHLSESGWGAAPDPSQAEEINSRFLSLSKEIADDSYKALFYSDIQSGMLDRQLRDAQVAFRRGGVKGLAQKIGRLRMRHVRRLLS